MKAIRTVLSSKKINEPYEKIAETTMACDIVAATKIPHFNIFRSWDDFEHTRVKIVGVVNIQ